MHEHATIRVAVLMLVVFSAAYALQFFHPIMRTLGTIAETVTNDSILAIAWVGAALLVMVGHVLRAWRDTKLFSKATTSRTRSQLGAFATGQLCSAVLPLKIGEFVRADIIAQRYRISYSFTLVLLCVERFVDAIVLLALSLIFVGFFIPLAIVAAALGFVIWVIWASPKWFKRLLSAIGSVLDDKVEARLLFTFWSLEYGLRRTLEPRVMAPYVLTGLLNWMIYIVAFGMVLHVATGGGFIACTSGSVGAYVALTTALTPAALGSYSSTLAGFGLNDTTLYIMLWMAAILPIALFGLYFALFKLRGLPLLRPKMANKRSISENKLSRNADASSDQLSFLKDYYSGKPLALKVAHDEIVGGPAVQRYLSGGGSGAVTYLSETKGKACVTKVVPLKKSLALKQQYSWLRDYSNPMIVGVSGEREDEETYAIDIDYEAGSLDCFEYVHSCTSAQRAELLDEIVNMLANYVWKTSDELVVPQALEARQRIDSYLAKHVEKSLALALEALPTLEPVFNAHTIVINGEKCENVQKLLATIRNSETIMNDLCSFRLSPSIHGDLILDNLIWSPSRKHPIVLDPVPCGNYIDGPVFDFGKLCQSLWVGYEFMLRDTTATKVNDLGDGTVQITFTDRRSAAYEQMWNHVTDALACRYLTESERRTMLFIGATNFLRRMKHQAVQCPANAPSFYAAGVQHLNWYVRKLLDE